jgi:hypothetical protein
MPELMGESVSLPWIGGWGGNDGLHLIAPGFRNTERLLKHRCAPSLIALRESVLVSSGPDFGKLCELSELCKLSPPQRLLRTAKGGWPEPIQDAIGLEWARAQPLPLRHAPLPGLGPVASGAILRLSKMCYQKRLGAALLLTKTAGRDILRRHRP